MPDTTERLLTADEYFDMPDDGTMTELVRGRVITVPQPGFNHGEICLNIGSTIRAFARSAALGRVVGNDSGVVTEAHPATVRGADVAYYSYVRYPRDQRTSRYPPVAPDLVVEVLSPSDRWPDVEEKIREYLAAGVTAVCTVDPEIGSFTIWRNGELPRTLSNGDEFALPDILPGFVCRVRDFFE